MSDEVLVRKMVQDWADAVAKRAREGILTSHAHDVLMFDFPATGEGIDTYARTWDFFDESPRGPVTFRPTDVRVSAFVSCAVPCDRTTARPLNFRLTTGFERRGEGDVTR